jgi:hypothetical protein
LKCGKGLITAEASDAGISAADITLKSGFFLDVLTFVIKNLAVAVLNFEFSIQ